MTVEYKFRSMTSVAGEEIILPTGGVVCVVGGNNVGKSQLLRELNGFATTTARELKPLVLSSVTVQRPSGTVEDAEAWLELHADEQTVPGERRKFAARVGGNGHHADDFHQWFAATGQGGAYLGNAAPFFVEHARAGELSAYMGGAIDSKSYNPRNVALVKLRMSGELEAAISDVTREAFGSPVILDRLDAQTRLRVGEVSTPVPPLNRPTREYARALSELPLLDDQGDGLRSFVGIVGQVLTHPMDVFLVDEPEAFLHPGQARVLGRWLARVATDRNLQVFVATHDRDLLLGLLSAEDGARVSVVRVAREGDASHLTQVSPDEIADVFAKPVLRYSNVLQGLFHSQVVVCEGDADCRFYGAALDAMGSALGKRSLADDTLFVPSGGKGQVSPLVRVLSTLGVRAWALPDFDVIRNRDELKSMVEGIGATWTQQMNDDYVTLTRAINDGVRWEAVKNSGLAAVPPGEPFAAAERLLGALRAGGVLVVPSGEMEGFYRGTKSQKSLWVSEALELRVHESSAVTDYLEPVLAAAGVAREPDVALEKRIQAGTTPQPSDTDEGEVPPAKKSMWKRREH
ncbi:ATP-dependent nuclease [Microbacterium sp. LWH3-1.2]|uniref:ATP-dependent nuclease n=1 Tax=Microbacterium sp. LWH3-1.2 TaxID=3135256 RepID=UPI003416E3A4